VGASRPRRARRLRTIGLLAKPSWTVEGKTQPTAASLEILNDWVTWMVGAGAEHGACEFDGWGTQPPPT
jgi:hypothetical protein